MSTTQPPRVLWPATRPLPEPRAPLTALHARVRAGRLDADLARGVPSWASPLHAARSRQLTSRRSRRAFADGLDELVARAGRSTVTFTAAVPICRAQVRHARPLLRRTAARLREDEPVDARGVALLRRLLSDGAGPCFVPSRRDALSVALAEVLAHLRAPGA